MATFEAEAETWRELYSETKNPLCVWAAIRSHYLRFSPLKAAPVPLPGWVLAYLGDAADAMWLWTEGREIHELAQLYNAASPDKRSAIYDAWMKKVRPARNGNHAAPVARILGFKRGGGNLFRAFGKLRGAVPALYPDDAYATCRLLGLTEEEALDRVTKEPAFDPAEARRSLRIARADTKPGKVKPKPLP